MQHDWMKSIPCSMKKWNPIEGRGYYAAWLNAVDSISMIECSGIFAACPKASRFNAVDSMQLHWMQNIQFIVAKWITIVCSGVHAASPNASRLNAVDFMQHGQKNPNWMPWIPCSVVKCILIERSVYNAAWLNGSPFNAVDSMHRGAIDLNWMQWIPCIMAQWIPIECSEIDAAWLNAVYSMQPGKMHPDW